MSEDKKQLPRALGLMATIDLLTGAVLAALGVSSESWTLTIVGAVLLIGGAGVLAVVTWRRNQPTTL